MFRLDTTHEPELLTNAAGMIKAMTDTVSKDEFS